MASLSGGLIFRPDSGHFSGHDLCDSVENVGARDHGWLALLDSGFPRPP